MVLIRKKGFGPFFYGMKSLSRTWVRTRAYVILDSIMRIHNPPKSQEVIKLNNSPIKSR